MNEQAAILVWITDSLERGAVSGRMPVDEAVSHAQKLDRPDLFAKQHNGHLEDDLDRGAVAGVAAVALIFGGELQNSDLTWATDVTFRACQTMENMADVWSPFSLPVHHPVSYALQGLKGLIRRGREDDEARQAILTLAAHPLEELSAEAISAALALWDIDPHFAWCGLRLGLNLSVGDSSENGYDRASTPSRVAKAVKEEIADLDSPEKPVRLGPLPPPWTKAPSPSVAESDDVGPEPPIWREPEEYLRWDFLPKILKSIPISLVMTDGLYRPTFVGLCFDLLVWTIERLAPSWLEEGSDAHDQQRSNLHEWCSSLFGFLAQVALNLDTEEVDRRFLAPMFHLEDKLAATLITPFVSVMSCEGILDSAQISPIALFVLKRCIERVLQQNDWEYARHRDGKIYGFELPKLIRVLLLVEIEHASLAARFANDDWQDISLLVPTIDPFVRAVGDIPSVTSAFLTLCEHAHEFYPPNTFVQQITAVLTIQSEIPAGWRNSTIPSRIAGLIQTFAEGFHPLSPSLAQGMLRILDRLVDMGDRRSAGLQTSEVFRDVRV
jgi:hypothetical protein